MDKIMIKKAIVDKKALDVIDEEEYDRRVKLADPMFEDTCIQKGDTLYPVRNKYDPSVVGVYDAGPFLKYTEPAEEDKEQYSANKIIDLGNTSNLRELIQAQDDYRREESALLTTVNNIWEPVIYNDDSPELVALKEGITYKQIDNESYRPRHGADFNNDTRLLKDRKNKTISFYKLKRYCDIYDLKATLIIEDKEGAINPMGRKIVKELTSEE
jgi:hypothetical protein